MPQTPRSCDGVVIKDMKTTMQARIQSVNHGPAAAVSQLHKEQGMSCVLHGLCQASRDVRAQASAVLLITQGGAAEQCIHVKTQHQHMWHSATSIRLLAVDAPVH